MAEFQEPIPLEIGRANQHDVKIRWQDGHESIFISRELRLACPCASCVDEMTGHVRLIAGSIAQTVHPVKVVLTGRYAVSITWSDGHNTGIYTFEKLRQLCSCSECQKPQGGCGKGSCGCRHQEAAV